MRMRMKYVVVLCDGMADEPLEELGCMDFAADFDQIGRAHV